MHSGGGVADAGELAEAALLGSGRQLVGVELADDLRGVAERLDLVGGRLRPLEQEGDAVECVQRLHGPTVPCGHDRDPEMWCRSSGSSPPRRKRSSSCWRTRQAPRDRRVGHGARPERGPPDRLELGSKFGMSMKVGVPYSMVSTVIEFDEPRRIAWQTRFPLGPLTHLNGGRIWRYDLEPVEGGTLVTETWDITQEKIKSIVRPRPRRRARRWSRRSRASRRCSRAARAPGPVERASHLHLPARAGRRCRPRPGDRARAREAVGRPRVRRLARAHAGALAARARRHGAVAAARRSGGQRRGVRARLDPSARGGRHALGRTTVQITTRAGFGRILVLEQLESADPKVRDAPRRAGPAAGAGARARASSRVRRRWMAVSATPCT